MRYLVVFLSGLCALVYQVVWVRLFIHVFGQSVYSTTTVVCAFMAGLGIGGYLAPRILSRWGRTAWALYALIELGIGITAASLPLLLQPITATYVTSATQGWGIPITLVKFILSFAALVIPTTLMGLTLPVVVQACADADAPMNKETLENTRRVGYLYGVNTAGAAIGCFLVGFVFLLAFGLRATIIAMAALNCFLALAIWLIFVRRSGPTPVSRNEFDTTVSHSSLEPAGERRRGHILLALYGLIGVASFGYEMCWFRTLVFFLQSATYSFSILLTTYLIGLAVGSIFFSRWLEPQLNRSNDPMVSTAIGGAVGQLLLGIIGATTLYACKEILPVVWQGIIQLIGARSIFAMTVGKIAVATFIILPPTFIMGAMFPMLVKLYRGPRKSEARAVGYLYAANTLGAVVGTLVTGFVLFNLIGLQSSLTALSVLSVCTGASLLFLFPQAPRLRYAIPITLTLTAVFGLAVFLVPPQLFIKIIEEHRAVKIVFHKESASDTVVVGDLGRRFAGGNVRELIYHDGRGTCLSALFTNQMQRFSAYSAMAENPDAKDVLVISFGCGNTASAFASFPIRKLDIVDLSSNVYAASRYFHTNYGVLDDPRVTAFVDDGRNYLLTTDQQYDIIELELPTLHTEGVVNLYTREFYELARTKLKPDGIVHQWIDVYQAERETGYMLINTMREVFPNTTRVWDQRFIFEKDLNVGGGMWWGVAQNRETSAPIFYDKVRALFSRPKVRRDMGIVYHTLPKVLARVIASPGLVEETVGDSRIITDDNTYVDFIVPNLRNPNAFGGGLGYYSAPLNKVMKRAWKEAGVFKNIRKDYYAFYSKENYFEFARAALLETLHGVPEDVMRTIIYHQRSDINGYRTGIP